MYLCIDSFSISVSVCVCIVRQFSNSCLYSQQQRKKTAAYGLEKYLVFLFAFAAESEANNIK